MRITHSIAIWIHFVYFPHSQSVPFNFHTKSIDCFLHSMKPYWSNQSTPLSLDACLFSHFLRMFFRWTKENPFVILFIFVFHLDYLRFWISSFFIRLEPMEQIQRSGNKWMWIIFRSATIKWDSLQRWNWTSVRTISWRGNASYRMVWLPYFHSPTNSAQSFGVPKSNTSNT